MTELTTEKKRVAICDTQPITAEGVRVLLESCQEFEFIDFADSLDAGTALVRASHPDLLIVDKAFGTHAVLEWLRNLKLFDKPPLIIVWGISMTRPKHCGFCRLAPARSFAKAPISVAS